MDFEIGDIFINEHHNVKIIKEELYQIMENKDNLINFITTNNSSKELINKKNSSVSNYKEYDLEKKIRNKESSRRYRERFKQKFNLLEKENGILKEKMKNLIELLNCQLCSNCKNTLLNKKRKNEYFIVKKQIN